MAPMSAAAQTPPASTGPVREAHAFDEQRLADLLSRRVEGFSGPLAVRQFDGGQSNPTFWLGTPDRAYVLRKKPPGKLLPSAHAVEREYRVMRALAATRVPVPPVRHLEEDPEVIGTPFYVMDFVDGRLFRNPSLTTLDREERGAIFDELVRVLADLHQVDVDAVGLGDFGKRGGYLGRQIKRWSSQYEASRTEDVPAMEALLAWLPEHVPEDDETTLTHGDYRIDNVLFDRQAPRARAVLDWELSTLGHPLADLAYLGMAYDIVMPDGATLVGVDLEAAGIPTEDELVARYCALTGRDGGIPHYPFFKAFSLFRLAAISQGVYARSLQGNASSTNASLFGAAVGILADIACRKVGLSPA